MKNKIFKITIKISKTIIYQIILLDQLQLTQIKFRYPIVLLLLKINNIFLRMT